MQEIDISIEKAKITDREILFDPVLAGKKTIRKVTLTNNLNYNLELRIIISGDVDKDISAIILPKEDYMFDIELNPNKNATKPITAKLDIDLSYVIK